MTEGQQQNTPQGKDILDTQVLRYLGKIFRKKGTGKKGAWTMYQLQFASGGNYPWKCTAFDPMSDKGIQLKEMIEGNFYRVFHKIEDYEHPQYGPRKSKTAITIKPATEAEQTNPIASSTRTGTATFDENTWNAFVVEYDTATANSTDTNFFHLLGVYVSNKCPQAVPAEVIRRAKQHFVKPTPTPEPVQDTPVAPQTPPLSV